jgi:hypothetical protein
MKFFEAIGRLFKVVLLLVLGAITLGLGLCNMVMLLNSTTQGNLLILTGVAIPLLLMFAFGFATRELWRSLQSKDKGRDASGDAESGASNRDQ